MKRLEQAKKAEMGKIDMRIQKMREELMGGQ